MLLKLALVRREEPALVHGVYRGLSLTNRQYAFARILEAGAIEVLWGAELPLENGRIQWEIPANGSAVFRIKQG